MSYNKEGFLYSLHPTEDIDILNINKIKPDLFKVRKFTCEEIFNVINLAWHKSYLNIEFDSTKTNITDISLLIEKYFNERQTAYWKASYEKRKREEEFRLAEENFKKQVKLGFYFITFLLLLLVGCYIFGKVFYG